MARKKILNIMYQSDDNYALISGISIASLLENNKHLDAIHIFYLGHKLKKTSITKFETLVANYNNATITFLDTTAYPKTLQSLGVKAWKGLYITWYKMLAFAEVQLKTDRLLYINPHTLITGSLDYLLELDFEDAVMALSYDGTMVNEHKAMIDLKPTDGYFNCGIMLINHKKWRKENIDSQLRNHLARHDYLVADQDLCNVLFRHKIKKIGVSYNFSTTYYGYDIRKFLQANSLKQPYFYSYDEIMESYYNPHIIHSQFAVVGKPWEQDSDNPLCYIWRSYARLTPWGIKSLPKAKKNLNWRLYQLLPQSILVRLYAFAVRRKFARGK